MAALIKHVLSKNYPNLTKISTRNYDFSQTRSYAKRIYKEKRVKVVVPKCRDLKSTENSLAARGFLRCQKNYQPPDNLEERLIGIYASVAGSLNNKNEKIPQKIRFELFNECFKELNHSVPNSILHTISNFNDLLAYYAAPVDAVLPLEKLKTCDLPPNLHIQYEPIRFHPDDDLKFNGQTAFPESNTLVTGVRTKKKFKGFKVTDTWPKC